MQLTHKRDKKIMNAKPVEMIGVPIAYVARPLGWQERLINAPIISDSRKIPKVLSSIVSLNRFCFPGFDWTLKTVDESDDTQGPRIDAALAQIKQIDKKIGRVGKSRKVGTLGMVRRTMLDTLSFRQSVNEYAQATDGQWVVPTEVQNIPSMTLYKHSPIASGDPNIFIQDKLLPGVVYDANQNATRFFQSKTASSDPVELNNEQIIYIEDNSIPDDTSFLASLIPSIEQWKEMRKNLMIGMHRGMAAPNEVARIDIADLAIAKDKGLAINIVDLINYATQLVQNQGTETAKLAMPGMKLEYPAISLPLNPTEPDKFLQMEIIAHFFARDILEVTAQAISATSAPGKAVLDALVNSYRETNGKPWEDWWYNVFLEPNGFGDLKLEFAWWDWSPKDKERDRAGLVDDLKNGGITINEYRQNRGYRILDDTEKQALIDEHDELFKPRVTPTGGIMGSSSTPLQNSAPSEHKELLDGLIAGAISKNEYRKKHGLPELTEAEIRKLAEEQLGGL